MRIKRMIPLRRRGRIRDEGKDSAPVRGWVSGGALCSRQMNRSGSRRSRGRTMGLHRYEKVAAGSSTIFDETLSTLFFFFTLPSSV